MDERGGQTSGGEGRQGTPDGQGKGKVKSRESARTLFGPPRWVSSLNLSVGNV